MESEANSKPESELLRPANRNLQLRHVGLALNAYNHQQRFRHAKPRRRRRALERHNQKFAARVFAIAAKFQSIDRAIHRHRLFKPGHALGANSHRHHKRTPHRQDVARHRAAARSRGAVPLAFATQSRIATPAASRTPSPRQLQCRSQQSRFQIRSAGPCSRFLARSPRQPLSPTAIETRPHYGRCDVRLRTRCRFHFRFCGRCHWRRSHRDRSRRFHFCDDRCHVPFIFSSRRHRAPPHPHAPRAQKLPAVLRSTKRQMET